MKNSFLLPYKFRFVGMALMGVGVIAIIFILSKRSYSYLHYISIATSVEIIGALIAICSKEKEEDELIYYFRLKSFFLATLFTSILVVLFNFFGFIFHFSTIVDPTLPIAFLQLFYICYFAYVRRNWLFKKNSL